MSSELWSTIHKVVHASLDPPKSTFRETIFRPLLHTLEIDQGLLAHTTNLVGGPQKFFKGEHLKYGPKIQHVDAYNFAQPHETLPGDVARDRSDNVNTN